MFECFDEVTVNPNHRWPERGPYPVALLEGDEDAFSWRCELECTRVVTQAREAVRDQELGVCIRDPQWTLLHKTIVLVICEQRDNLLEHRPTLP